MSPELLKGVVVLTTAEAGQPPPAPPKLVIGDRRFDPARLEHVVGPTLAAERPEQPDLPAAAATNPVVVGQRPRACAPWCA
jgi:hypothetical protein